MAKQTHAFSFPKALRGLVGLGCLLVSVDLLAAITEVSLEQRGETLRIAVIGDTGLGTTRIAAGLAAITDLDAVILVGDNFYPCGVRSAEDPQWKMAGPLSALGIPIFAILGNHDYCGVPDAQVNAPVPGWHMPARQYALRTRAADFAMLDTTPYATRRDPAIETAVAETFTGSSVPWRIAVGHHVIASSGWHGLFPRREVANMRRLLPLLRDQHVDVYICGHDHHEELLAGDPLLLISGAGSDPVPMIQVRDETLWPRRTHFREPIAFSVLEITAERLRIRFYEATGHAGSPWFDFAR